MKKTNRSTLGRLCAALVLGAASTTFADVHQEPRPDGPLARRMDVAPVIDGNLAEWATFPQIKMNQPNVPDLKVTRASMGWDDDALHVAFRVMDAVVVNSNDLARLGDGDCFDLRIASAPNRKTFLRLLAAPSSAEGKPACTLARRTVGTKAAETLLATTEPSTLDGFQWALAREEKAWTVEATIPFPLLGRKPALGATLPFVAVVWDRDRTDVDEWTAGSGWHKRSESSSQKAPVENWPVITLADAAAKEVVQIKDGVSIVRRRPCNLFTPDQKVELSFTLKGFPEGGCTATGEWKDAFGRGGLKTTALAREGDRKDGPFVFDLGRLERGYYEFTLTVANRDAESSAKISLGVIEQEAPGTEAFLEQDRRFGLKWWGGVADKPETVEMMCRLGLLWTRASVGESLQIVTNSTLLSVVKIERFPAALFDEARYGALADYEKKFGRGSWTLKTLPREAEYKAWLAEEIAKLPANQTVFEIWNEPWDKMSPEDFSTISKWIRDVVTQVRPDAKLGPNLRGDMSDYGYDAKVVAAGGMAGMDLVCLHPYGASEDRAFLRKYKQWISEKTGRGIDIYITEYGSHSCPSGPARRTEVEQARAVVRQSLALYAEDAKALIPHWVGQSERNPTYHEDWFGYIRRNQQPKPVLIAHANSARLIDGGKYLGDLWFGPGIGAMVFKKDGENRLALFTRGEPNVAEVDAGVAEIAVVDMFGGERKQATRNGKVKLSLGPDVVYLCGLSDQAVAGASPELRDDRWPKPEKPPRNRRAARKMKMPTLDGKFDDWKGATELYIHNPKVNGDDASGLGRLAWDDNHLYLGVDMRDNELFNKQPRAKLYRGDSIELFVSTEVREENPGYGPFDHQFFLTPTSAEGVPVVARLTDREAGILEDVADAKCFLGKTSQGWAGEIALPWSGFPGFKPKAGAQIALEFRVNDADTSHERWKLDPTDVGFVHVEDPTSWSVLTLED
ncbi:MAG: sugar-binding protein [Kiritimatiellia bacterium]